MSNRSLGHQSSTQHQLQQRTLGKCTQNRISQASLESMNRLALETCLSGHSGCINCLEWNSSGQLLASGSDDRNVIIWDPFKQTKKNTLQTGHTANIFSVKFLPQTCDTLLGTCAGDGQVKLINTFTNGSILNCTSCHIDRVKRLAVHTNEPNLMWSAGEEGYILQYDVRESHICNQQRSSSSKPKNLLIDLKSSGLYLSAKCLAINPIRDEMIAVGSDDVFVRMFDRRYISKTRSVWDSCTSYFAPGHSVKSSQLNNGNRTKPSLGATYVSFSPNGAELLVNLHADQVYLFNTYEPWERYKSFDATVKHLILDQPIKTSTAKLLNSSNTTDGNLSRKVRRSFRKIYSNWGELRKFNKCDTLPKEYNEFYRDLLRVLSSKNGTLSLKDLDRLNQILVVTKYCPDLYALRAKALIGRNWKGDYYQAIRDCCCALALNPMHYKSLINLAYASFHMSDFETAVQLLANMRIIQQEFGFNDELDEAIRALKSMLKDRNSDLSLSSSSLNILMEEDDNGVSDRYPLATQIRQIGALGPSTPSSSSISSSLQNLSTSPSSNGSSSPMQLVDYDDDVEDETQDVFLDTRAPQRRLVDFQTDTTDGHKETPTSDSTHQMFEPTQREIQRGNNSLDYSKRFCGHLNVNTDIKEANFLGHNGEFVVGGSDDGAFYIWDKKTTNIIKAVKGDMQTLNCLQPHPSICMLATSGVEHSVKLWSPTGKICRDIGFIETQCNQNQRYNISDPWEAMIMMLYRPR